MNYELESIETDFLDIRKMLNKMHLYDGLGYYAYLILCLIPMLGNIQYI